MDSTYMAVTAADLFKIAAAALLGFLANFILQYVQARRQPKRRIMYDISVVSALEQVEATIASDIDISFRGEPVKRIEYHRVQFTNIGNSQINEQTFRIQIPKNSKLLKYYFDPEPELELGIQDSGFDEKSRSWIFELSLFRPNERIVSHMIIDSESAKSLEVFSKNKEEYVELVPGRIESLQDERSKLSTFLLLVSLWFLIPPVTELIIFGDIQPIAAGSVRLILLAFIIPRLGFACHELAGVFISLQSKDKQNITSSGRDIISAGRDVLIAGGEISIEHPGLKPAEEGMELPGLNPAKED